MIYFHRQVNDVQYTYQDKVSHYFFQGYAFTYGFNSIPKGDHSREDYEGMGWLTLAPTSFVRWSE